MSTLKDMLAGACILAKYGENTPVHAGYDVLLVEIKEGVVSKEDEDALKKYSWWYSTDYDGWGFFP